MTFYFLKPKTIIVDLTGKILTLTFLRGKCDEKLWVQIESGFDSHWLIYVGEADKKL
jgi:hypothetical protein